jgi:hypothetical protein
MLMRHTRMSGWAITAVRPFGVRENATYLTRKRYIPTKSTAIAAIAIRTKRTVL